MTGDNAGLDNTGRYQMAGTLTVDSPLFLYDSLTISGSSNANVGNGAAGTRSSAINYSIPFGYRNVFFNANQSRLPPDGGGFRKRHRLTAGARRSRRDLAYAPLRNASGDDEPVRQGVPQDRQFHAGRHRYRSAAPRFRRLLRRGAARRQYFGRHGAGCRRGVARVAARALEVARLCAGRARLGWQVGRSCWRMPA
ncbi:ShlB/FhaC/HecB family hemolysin secretion/activation protein [Cupriavidus basilensis]